MRDDIFEKCIRGRAVISCAIMRPGVYGFVLACSSQEDMEKTDVPFYYLTHFLNEQPGEKREDLITEVIVDTGPRMAVDLATPQLLIAYLGGNVFVHDAGGGVSEKRISRSLTTAVENVRFIGESFFIAGAPRRILQRAGKNQWQDLTKSLHTDLPASETLDWGFSDVDGFTEQDLVAVGGVGDAWRYDGQKWHQLDLPTNRILKCVCCASNGQAYIGGAGHMILRGRNDRWEVLHEATTNDTFMQLLEYNEQVYAVDEWGNTLYRITDDGVEPVDMGGFSLPATGGLCMAQGHGKLLLGGLESASVFDGQTWKSVFRNAEADEIELSNMMLQDMHSALDELMKDLNDSE
ncbi:MAG: hypothetical protein R3C53_16465 [Pirellulaceae bacterium]